MSDLAELDDIQIDDDPDSDDHVRMNKRDVNTLRARAKKAGELEKEIQTRDRRDAIASAGLTGLTDKQRAALVKIVDDPTAENYRSEAEALGWVEAAPPDPNAVTDAELAEHAAVTEASTGAAGAPAIRHVKPADVTAWSMEKLMRLNTQHPDLYEKLLRDEEIDLPPQFVL